ncbi:MAG: glyoxalase, partial [Proteobacteria bacterium]|nr:glyoxalase [Pseudomonadota bacterium]
MKIQFNRLNHIQICIPKGEEQKGREFYCDILGIQEIEKPDSLKANGGFWLELNDIQIHIGTEELTGKSKRHPAFEVNNLAQVKEYLQAHNIATKDDTPIPGYDRFSI